MLGRQVEDGPGQVLFAVADEVLFGEAGVVASEEEAGGDHEVGNDHAAKD